MAKLLLCTSIMAAVVLLEVFGNKHIFFKSTVIQKSLSLSFHHTTTSAHRRHAAFTGSGVSYHLFKVNLNLIKSKKCLQFQVAIGRRMASAAASWTAALWCSIRRSFSRVSTGCPCTRMAFTTMRQSATSTTCICTTVAIATMRTLRMALAFEKLKKKICWNVWY